jgi:two-component system sensor kinase FixL
MGTVTTRQPSIIVAAHLRNSRAIEISVTDTGPGVPEELAGNIFEPFVTTKPLGMGMGLSISRSIVESHGGNLWVATTAGSGAIFAFDLPLEGVVTVPDESERMGEVDDVFIRPATAACH